MSYILEALRKSAEERRRQQESGPFPYTVPTIPPPSGSRRRSRQTVWLVSLTIVLSAAVSSLAVWYLTARNPLKPPAVENASTAASFATDKRNGLPPQALSEEKGRIDRQDDLSPEARSTPSTRTPDAQEISPVRQEGPASQQNTPPRLEELPLAIRAAIPELKFSGHVYSPTPSRRMIMANASIVREGDMITPQLKLEEITEDGLLLDYQGTLFRVMLF